MSGEGAGKGRARARGRAMNAAAAGPLGSSTRWSDLELLDRRALEERLVAELASKVGSAAKSTGAELRVWSAPCRRQAPPQPLLPSASGAQQLSASWRMAWGLPAIAPAPLCAPHPLAGGAQVGPGAAQRPLVPCPRRLGV